MSQNFNLAIARDHVHAIRCAIRKLEIAIDDSLHGVNRDLAEIRRLQRQLDDAERAAYLERIVLMCNTPCWRFRVV